MRVRLEDIPPQGREVAFPDKHLAPNELGPQVLAVTEPPYARLHLMCSGDRVMVKGQYQARLRLSCSRCLKEMDFVAQGPVELIFLPRSSATEEEIHLAQEDMEVCFYEGGEIDLGQAVRDEISLAVPMAPVCKEGCPGICPVCGRSLENGACGCSNEDTDPRWAKLKDFKSS